jgi:hypothetical protein
MPVKLPCTLDLQSPSPAGFRHKPYRLHSCVQKWIPDRHMSCDPGPLEKRTRVRLLPHVFSVSFLKTTMLCYYCLSAGAQSHAQLPGRKSPGAGVMDRALSFSEPDRWCFAFFKGAHEMRPYLFLLCPTCMFIVEGFDFSESTKSIT